MNSPYGWPSRTSICLDCRTALSPGGACPHGHERVRSLHDPGGREDLVTEVWGPKEWRATIRNAAAAGATGGCSLSWGDCLGCDLLGGGEGALLVLGFLAVFSACFLLWLAGRYLLNRWRQRQVRNALRGATAELASAPSTGCFGVVVASAPALLAPLGGGACVAFAAELTNGRKRAVLLRDGASLGFTVQLDSGERVVVPAGACVLELGGAARLEEGGATRYLAALDPLRARGEELDPFLHDRVAGVTVRPGDRVEVLSPLRACADAGAMGSYRESAMVLVPQAPARLRLVESPR